MARRWRILSVIVALGLLLAGCSASSEPVEPQPDAELLAQRSLAAEASLSVLADTSLEQRVGQLFMFGTSASVAEDATIAAVRDRFVGSVFLSGRSHSGVDATAAVVAEFTAANPTDIPLFVATDQEGGQVQVLSGPGFSAMPTARRQGQMGGAELQAAATVWGAELAAAGVNVNLAPVGDIVTGPRSGNQPIARFHREYGYESATVIAQAGAFMAGMTEAGVSSTLKHFPGLGYVRGNTDVSASVTDSVVAADSDVVYAFGQLVAAGAPMVMMSSAVYELIDPAAPAVFSPTAVSLLRDSLGFVGLIITDDLSGAAQVQAWTPAERAILAIQAGVDIVLVVHHPDVLAEMVDAVVAKAQTDPAFAARVDEAATHVILQKLIVGIG